MSDTFDLTAEQRQFLAHACGFIATNPPQGELDKLLTLAEMLLPVPVAEMLAKRAAMAGSPGTDGPQTRLVQ